MSGISKVEELIEKKKAIKPLYGNTYEIQDGQTLNELEIMIPETELGVPTFNEDGSLARTPKKYLVVNSNYLYDNRYRKVDDKTIEVCTDNQMIKKQGTGELQFVTNSVLVYKIGREDKRKKLQLLEVKTVSVKEFEKEFTHKFKDKVMRDSILPIIENVGEEITEDDLDI